jgi:hypothetical protein
MTTASTKARGLFQMPWGVGKYIRMSRRSADSSGHFLAGTSNHNSWHVSVIRSSILIPREIISRPFSTYQKR